MFEMNINYRAYVTMPADNVVLECIPLSVGEVMEDTT